MINIPPFSGSYNAGGSFNNSNNARRTGGKSNQGSIFCTPSLGQFGTAIDLGVDLRPVQHRIYQCKLRYHREIWKIICEHGMQGGRGGSWQTRKNPGGPGPGPADTDGGADNEEEAAPAEASGEGGGESGGESGGEGEASANQSNLLPRPPKPVAGHSAVDFRLGGHRCRNENWPKAAAANFEDAFRHQRQQEHSARTVRLRNTLPAVNLATVGAVEQQQKSTFRRERARFAGSLRGESNSRDCTISSSDSANQTSRRTFLAGAPAMEQKASYRSPRPSNAFIPFICGDWSNQKKRSTSTKKGHDQEKSRSHHSRHGRHRHSKHRHSDIDNKQQCQQKQA